MRSELPQLCLKLAIALVISRGEVKGGTHDFMELLYIIIKNHVIPEVG